MKKSILLILTAVSLLFVSCSTISVASSIAGDLGLIDKNVAKSISTASTSLGKAMEEITPEQEYYIGRAVAGTILEKYNVYNSAKMQKYLNEICSAIVINSDKPVLYKGYYVAILDTDEVNAFATSGGHILVSRGLLQCAKSEDALAAVLSHEIAHIQLQHSIKAIKSSRATSAILQTAGTAVTLYNNANDKDILSGFDDSISDIISTMVESGYSKQQEFDADSKALSLMAQAGYNPNAMKSMLDLLKEKEKGQTSGFSKTHPSPESREKNLQDQYDAYQEKTYDSSRVARFNKIKSLL
ncbi:MAG: M48 family metallopeptidase [Treponema sp.]